MDLTLIFFAGLALFLSYRLFNELGNRGGHEPDERERPVLRPVGASDAPSEGATADIEPSVKTEKLPEWAEVIAENYRGFSPSEFLDGAASAYEMIVQAYADGDLSSVRRFVADDVLDSFQSAIDARTGQGHEMRLTFVGVQTPKVKRSEKDGNTLRVELEFTSEQVRVVKDGSGQTIEGNEEAVITVVDCWAFTRPAKSNDPNWTLVATHGSDA
ncbi:MAG: Tim44/TimA family putative adaptor protein [Pseudomonadota bacterium]